MEACSHHGIKNKKGNCDFLSLFIFHKRFSYSSAFTTLIFFVVVVVTTTELNI